VGWGTDGKAHQETHWRSREENSLSRGNDSLKAQRTREGFRPLARLERGGKKWKEIGRRLLPKPSSWLGCKMRQNRGSRTGSFTEGGARGTAEPKAGLTEQNVLTTTGDDWKVKLRL